MLLFLPGLPVGEEGCIKKRHKEMNDKKEDPDEGLKAEGKVPIKLGQTPYKRKNPLPGRNDKCPCGSGLKFKQCCEKNMRLRMQLKFIEARQKKVK